MAGKDGGSTWEGLGTWTDEATAALDTDSADVPTDEHERYERRDDLGAGSIGSVVRIYDRQLGREIARKELTRRGDALRFRREARVTAQLEHPNIVPVYDMGLDPDGTRFYTMKLVRGRTLKEALADCPDLRARLELLPHFVDACQALAYAHSRGVVHRDLKPANIMIGEFGETQVMDWGLARVRGEVHADDEALARQASLLDEIEAGHTVVGTVMGTPSYMSPEQAEGRVADIDERSDVWGLGGLLFHILTGRRPYEGKDGLEVVTRVRTEAVPPVASIEPGAPPELAAVVARAMQRDRDARYATAADLAAEVEAYRAGGLVRAYAYTSREILERWLARRRRAIGVGVAMGGVLLVTAVGFTWSLAQQRDIAETAAEDAREAEKDALAAEKDAQQALARSLVQQAQRLLRDELIVEAEVLAAGSLLLAESPGARGVLANARARWTPELEAVLRPAAGCRDLEVTADAVYCCSAEGLLALDLDGTERWRAGQTCRAVERSDRYLLRTDEEGRLDVVDEKDGSTRWTVLDLEQAWIRAIHLDGDRLLIGRNRELVVHDLATRTDVAEQLTSSFITAIDVPPDGATVDATTVSGHVYRYSLPDLSARIHRVQVDERGLFAAAWLQDGLVVGGGGNRARRLDDDLADVVVYAEGHTGPVYTLGDHGNWLATGSEDGAARIFDRRTARLVATLPFHEGWFALVRFHDGDLYTSSRSPTIQRWSLPDGPDGVLPTPGGVADVVWSPDGTLLLAGDGEGKAHLFHTRTGRRRTIYEGKDVVTGGAFSPDGSLVLVVIPGHPIRVFDVFDPTQGAVATFGHRAGPAARDVAFSSDGNRVFVARMDGTIEAWSVGDWRRLQVAETGSERLYELEQQAGVLTAMDFASTVVVLDERLEVIDVERFPPIRAHTLSPDGSQVAVGRDDFRLAVRNWRDDTDGHELVGATHGIGALAFLPGNRLAAASWDRHIRIWDLDDGELVALLQGHGHRVSGLSLSPDGTRLASASWDATVRLWDLTALDASPSDLVRAAHARHGARLDGPAPVFDP